MRACFILLFLLIYATGSGQYKFSRIDSLMTESDVQRFVRSIDKEFAGFVLKPTTQVSPLFGFTDFCTRVKDSLKLEIPFIKADFDNNTKTDLLVTGEYPGFTVIVFMHLAYDSIKPFYLTSAPLGDCIIPKTGTRKNFTTLEYFYGPDHSYWSAGNEKDSFRVSKKELIFKFGGFVEYAEKENNYSIEKIEYSTTGCFGSCPVFSLSVKNTGEAIFDAKKYNSQGNYWAETRPVEITGRFETRIDPSHLSSILDLLNYLDFPSLENNYAVSWTDDQACTLKITYDNGQTKTIKDYGKSGTHGLARLYRLLFDLRFNQTWKRISKKSKS
ncbi:MAG: DUF6438 domain-containing protein [Bacteroidota bacterium]